MLRINGAPHYADFKRKESEGDTHSLIAFQNAASHEADVLNDGPSVSTVKNVCYGWEEKPMLTAVAWEKKKGEKAQLLLAACTLLSNAKLN